MTRTPFLDRRDGRARAAVSSPCPHGASARVRRPRGLVAVVAGVTTLAGVLAVPPAASADPGAGLRARASGSGVAVPRVSLLGRPAVGPVSFASTTGTLAGDAAVAAASRSANVGAGPLGLAVETAAQTAPPDNASPGGRDLAGVTVPGLLATGVATVSNSARWSSDPASCLAPATVLTDGSDRLAGLTVVPDVGIAGLGSLAVLGAVTTTAQTSLPQVQPGVRAASATTSAAVAPVSVLGGAATVQVDRAPVLEARAAGSGAANRVGFRTAPAARLVVGGTSTQLTTTPQTVTIGASALRGLATAQVTARLGTATTTTSSATAVAASASAVELSVSVRAVGGLVDAASADVSVAPMEVSAAVPAGGVTCPRDLTPAAPVVTAPAEGADTGARPALTGTGQPGATVTATVDGTVVGTGTVSAAGGWSTGPVAALPAGPVTVAVAQRLDGAPSPAVQLHLTVGAPTPTPTASATPTPTPTPTPAGSPSETATPTTVPSSTDVPSPTATASPSGTTAPTGTPSQSAAPTQTPTPSQSAGPTGSTTPTGEPSPTDAPTGSPTATGDPSPTGTPSATVHPSPTGGTTGTASPAPTAPVPVSPVHIDTPATGDDVPADDLRLTGTGAPGATVTVTAGGDVLAAGTVAADGRWSLVSTAVLAAGPVVLVATQSIDGSPTGSDAVEVQVTGPETAGPTPTESAPPTGSPTESPAPTASGSPGGSTAPAESTSPTQSTSPVTFGEPLDGATTSPTPDLSGTAEPGAVVVVTAGDPAVVLASTLATADGRWSAGSGHALPAGPNTLTARQSVDGSAAGTATVTVGVVADPGPTPVEAGPVVLHPADGAVLDDAAPLFTGTGEPDATITLALADRVLGATTATAGGRWSVRPAVELPTGTVELTVVQRSGLRPPVAVRLTVTVAPRPTPTPTGFGDPTAGPSGTPTTEVSETPTPTTTPAATGVPDPAPPLVTTPAEGSRTSSTRPLLAGTGQPGSVVEVRQTAPVAAVLGSATVGADGTWRLRPAQTLAVGRHVVVASQTVAGGTRTDSPALGFTVTAGAPAPGPGPAPDPVPAPGPVPTPVAPPAAPVVTTPAPGSSTSLSRPVLAGTGVPGARVTVTRVGAGGQGSAAVGADGRWSLVATPGFAPGPVVLRATQTLAGRRSAASAPDAFTVLSPGGRLVSRDPVRLLDTRTGNGLPPGRRGPFRSLVLQVTGRGGVPADGSVAAVLVNVTTTGPAAAGQLGARPVGQRFAAGSWMAFAGGRETAELLTVPVGTGGRIELSSTVATNAVVDLQGWFTTPSADPSHAGRFESLRPARIVDTRRGFGGTRLGRDGTGTYQVTGRGGVPARGVAAVLLTLTATGASADSHLDAFPAGHRRSGSSSVNFPRGVGTRNQVLVPVGAGGRVSVRNFAGSVDLVVDVTGWVTAADAPDTGGWFVAAVPRRVADTRAGARPGQPSQRLAAGRTVTVRITGQAGIPSAVAGRPVQGVLATVRSVAPAGPGGLDVRPAGAPRSAGTVPDHPGRVSASDLYLGGLGRGGALSVTALGSATDLSVDVTGWFVGDPTP